MRKIYQLFICVIILVTFFACTKMNDLHQEYLDRGEQIYIGAIDSIIAYPGNNYIKMKCVVNSDPKIKKLKVSWNEGTEEKEKLVDFVRQSSGSDTIEFEIETIPEDTYLFNFITLDDKNNSSINTEFTATVYGQNYIDKLMNKSIEGLNATDSSFYISWKPNPNAVSVKIVYINSQGDKNTILIPESEAITEIKDWKLNSEIIYQTEFKPHKNAIGRFFAKAEILMTPDCFLLSKKRFKQIHLHADVLGQAWGGNINKLWNDVVHKDDFFHSGQPGDKLPQTITFDMGVKAKMHEFKVYPRPVYPDGNPRDFEIWGIADIKNAETTLDADDQGWTNESIDKGWSKMATINLSDDIDKAKPYTVEVKNPDKFKNVRYIRIRFIKNFTGEGTHILLGEFECYATEIN